jgi:hypothetical protein
MNDLTHLLDAAEAARIVLEQLKENAYTRERVEIMKHDPRPPYHASMARVLLNTSPEVDVVVVTECPLAEIHQLRSVEVDDSWHYVRSNIYHYRPPAGNESGGVLTYVLPTAMMSGEDGSS